MTRDDTALALAGAGLVVSIFGSCMPNLADVYAAADTPQLRRAQIVSTALAVSSALVLAGAARSWPVAVAGAAIGASLAVTYGKARQA